MLVNGNEINLKLSPPECIKQDRKTKEPAPEATTQVMEHARQNGLLIGKGGLYGNVLRLAPHAQHHQSRRRRSHPSPRQVLLRGLGLVCEHPSANSSRPNSGRGGLALVGYIAQNRGAGLASYSTIWAIGLVAFSDLLSIVYGILIEVSGKGSCDYWLCPLVTLLGFFAAPIGFLASLVGNGKLRWPACALSAFMTLLWLVAGLAA